MYQEQQCKNHDPVRDEYEAGWNDGLSFGVKACGWQYGDTPNTEGLYVARDAEGNIEVGMWYARGANGVAANWTRQFNDLNRDDIVAWIRIPDYAPNT